MPRLIKITGPVVETLLEVPPSRLRDFIGFQLTADGQAVLKLRELNPQIPTIPNTYEVAFGDALEALALANKFDAATEWSVIPPHLIYVPHTSAIVVEETT